MNGPVLVLFFFLLLTEAGDSPDTVGVGLPGSPPFASGGCVPGSCGHFVGGVCSCWGPEQRRGPGKFHGSLSYGLKPVVGLALQALSSTWGRRSSARPAPSGSLCPAFWPHGHRPSPSPPGAAPGGSGKGFAARPHHELPAQPPVPSAEVPTWLLAALVAQDSTPGALGSPTPLS